MASMLMLVFFYSPWFVGWPPLVCLAYRHSYKIAHSFWQPYFITYGDTKCLTKKVAIFGCVQALYGGTLLVSDRINSYLQYFQISNTIFDPEFLPPPKNYLLQVCLQFHRAKLGFLEPASPRGDRPLQIPSRLPCSPKSEPGRWAPNPDQRDEGSDQCQLRQWADHRFQCGQHFHLFALYQQGGDIQV